MNYAIILASGEGARLGLSVPKQYVKVKDKTILEYTLEKFENNLLTDGIILVVNKDCIPLAKELSSKFEKVINIVEGGKTRQQSSYNGVFSIKETEAKVLIHDACRPLISHAIINNCYLALDEFSAIDTGIETADTIVQVDEDGFISKTIDRKTLRRCQTPQGFKLSLIKKAHENAVQNNITVTDDVGLVAALNNEKIYVVKGDVDNIKITYPDDIKYFEEKLKSAQKL